MRCYVLQAVERRSNKGSMLYASGCFAIAVPFWRAAFLPLPACSAAVRSPSDTDTSRTASLCHWMRRCA